jgi:hypothetical protein
MFVCSCLYFQAALAFLANSYVAEPDNEMGSVVEAIPF